MATLTALNAVAAGSNSPRVRRSGVAGPLFSFSAAGAVFVDLTVAVVVDLITTLVGRCRQNSAHTRTPRAILAGFGSFLTSPHTAGGRRTRITRSGLTVGACGCSSAVLLNERLNKALVMDVGSGVSGAAITES